MKDSTPASNETKLGILNKYELDLLEAACLKKTFDYLYKHLYLGFDSLLINQAHYQGFKELYSWAGEYRNTEPMVGHLELAPYYMVPTMMKNLCDDLECRQNYLDADDLHQVVALIAWFEHKFIVIHPYNNTNGRMGRMLTNIILLKLGYPLLTYANRSLNRSCYIDAMRAADKNDFSKLECIIAEDLDHAIQDYQLQL
jgi:fido (protein-threonine AMPylation protein)